MWIEDAGLGAPVDLSARLRLPSVDGEEVSRSNRCLVVGRWLDRAGWALERLETEPMGERLAAELLITWQALGRMADDVVHEEYREERHTQRERLEQVVLARREELTKLAPQSFTVDTWMSALGEYAAQVGPAPQRWSEEQAAYAVMLLEGLDDALLLEAALEALEAEFAPESVVFLEQLHKAAVVAGEHAGSLLPAQGLIQATCWTLRPIPEQALGSYPLWLKLVDVYAAWAIFEGLVQLGVRAMREP